MDQFLESNKLSQEEHLDKVKKIREENDKKLKQMKENIRERVLDELTHLDRKYKKQFEINK